MTNWFRLQLETHPWPPEVGDDLNVLDVTAFSKITELTSNATARIVDLGNNLPHAVADVTPAAGRVVEMTATTPPTVVDLTPTGAFRVVDVTPSTGEVVEILNDPLLVQTISS